jgi:lysophospholipase L1-like esterase
MAAPEGEDRPRAEAASAADAARSNQETGEATAPAAAPESIGVIPLAESEVPGSAAGVSDGTATDAMAGDGAGGATAVVEAGGGGRDQTGGAPSGGSGASGESPTCNLSGAASATTPTIWVIGDSTASVYAADLYPRMGWAQPLQDYFAPACATTQDRAISGRSSKSFFDEGAWTPVRDALRAGDYVLIQFGHNDEKSDDLTRFTEPFTTFEQYLSIYIDDTQARGATPVLLTPIQRNNWTGTTVRDTHGDYPVAMRQLAEQRGVALVDATLLTKAYFERIGQAATTLLFMDLAVGQFPNYPAGNTDNTHLQEGGAHAVAELILADFARQELPIGRLPMIPPVAP